MCGCVCARAYFSFQKLFAQSGPRFAPKRNRPPPIRTEHDLLVLWFYCSDCYIRLLHRLKFDWSQGIHVLIERKTFLTLCALHLQSLAWKWKRSVQMLHLWNKWPQRRTDDVNKHRLVVVVFVWNSSHSIWLTSPSSQRSDGDWRMWRGALTPGKIKTQKERSINVSCRLMWLFGLVCLAGECVWASFFSIILRLMKSDPSKK